MKLRSGFAVIAAGILLQLAALPAFAQVITEGPDSVVVNTAPIPAQTIPDTTQAGAAARRVGFLSTWDRPAKAALYSAVVPGLGQVYNGAWWKVPIVYATGGVLGYYLVDNNRKYQSYRKALIIRNDTISTTFDEYHDNPDFPFLATDFGTGAAGSSVGTSNLRRYRDYYRRNRDLTILLSFLAWGMQVAEAHIHAHMKDFDVSDDLALRIKPNLIRIPATATYTPALTFTLYTKAK